MKPVMVELAAHFANPREGAFPQVMRGIVRDLGTEEPPEPPDPALSPRPGQRKKPILPHQVEEMAARYEAGATLRDIGEEYGISRVRVSSLLTRAGVSIRNDRMSPEQVELAVHLYGTGQSLVQVGERIGRAGTTVRRALLREGVVMRDEHGRPKDQVIEVEV